MYCIATPIGQGCGWSFDFDIFRNFCTDNVPFNHRDNGNFSHITERDDSK